MRLIRFRSADGAERFGALEGAAVHEVRGDVFGTPDLGPALARLEDVRLLAPCLPTKVVCVGRNYLPHIREMGQDVPERPLIFFKPPSAVIGPDAAIERPPVAQRFDYEGELAIVIGRPARGLTEETYRDFVLGYTCANDVTVRDWQADGQWTRAKGSDTFCPLGPWIETQLPSPSEARLRTSLNGELRQDGSTADLLFGLGALLSFITEWITLEPGDVVLTGTPGGVGPMVDGDVVEVEVEGIGVLRNTVSAPRASRP